MASTSSTLPAVKSALVDLLTTALATSGASGGAVHVDYSWNPNVEDEAVFLGRRTEDGPSWSHPISHDLAAIKAGRERRNENYPIELTVWSYRGDLTPADAEEAESRAFTLLTEVEDVLANDSKLGLTSIQWAKVRDIEVTGGPHGAGLRVEIVVTIEVQALLT